MGYDFSKIKIKVNEVTEGQDIVKMFIQLSQLEEFSQYSNPDRNKIVKYVVYAYDPGSPFMEIAASDLKKRKGLAAGEAGFIRDNKGMFTEEVQSIMNLENSEVNDMIFAYLRIINNRTWSLIIMNEQMFSEYTRLVMEPVEYSSRSKQNNDNGQEQSSSVVKDDKKLLEAANLKTKLREECKLIVEDLKKLYKEFFGDNDDIKDKVTAKPIRPENI